MPKTRPASERILAFYTPEPNSGCWLWTGSIGANGYGCFYNEKATKPAHRVSYELHKGLIPSGLVLDHLCRVPSCVNPDHLRIVTIRENVLCGTGLAAKNANKTHCKNGHELTPDNLLTNQLKYGKRSCKTCGVQRNRDWRKRVSMRSLDQERIRE